MTAGKRRGSAFESAVVAFLAEHGFPAAERRVMGGTRDRADVAGIPGWTLELKAEHSLDLAGALTEAKAHAHVEDHICRLKDSGLLRFPFTSFAANCAWLAVVGFAARWTTWPPPSPSTSCTEVQWYQARRSVTSPSTVSRGLER